MLPRVSAQNWERFSGAGFAGIASDLESVVGIVCAGGMLRRNIAMPAPIAEAYFRRSGYTVTWVPTSTTRPVGIWKKSVASLADFASPMNK
jgi:hypothetical protein